MTSALTDLGVVVGMTLIFLVLSWSYMRALNVGQPLRPSQRKMLVYGFVFVLGMGCVLLLGTNLHLSKQFLPPLIGFWGLSVAGTAWWRYRRGQRGIPLENPRRPVSVMITEGLPAGLLLISVIAGAVEWEYIFDGQGRWWVGVLWLAGAAVSVLAARQHRRTTVIAVLRVVVALLIIGAIAQRTPPALIGAVILSVALLVLEKFWHSNQGGGDQVGNSSGRGLEPKSTVRRSF